MKDNIKLYITHCENKKTKKIIIPKNKNIKYLKYKIINKFKLNIKDIKIKYGVSYYKNNDLLGETNIPNNGTLFISTTKLKGGDIGLAYGLITVPNTALMINLLFLIIACPITYFFIMYGTTTKIRILKMKYSSSFFANFNNFKIREVYDDVSKKDLEKDKFPNFKYRILKSRLYMIYSILYFAFTSFFANLLPLNGFIQHYGKTGSGPKTSQCYLHSDTSSILVMGILILGIIPGIIIFLNYFGFQYGLIFHLLALAIGGAALFTSIWYKRYQSLEKAIQYRDPKVPKSTYNKKVNHMPSWFWQLYITPIICLVVIIVFYLLDIKHSIIWGLICSFSGVVPLMYVMGNQMDLYCIQFPLCIRSSDQLTETIKKNDFKVGTAIGTEDLFISIRKKNT